MVVQSSNSNRNPTPFGDLRQIYLSLPKITRVLVSACLITSVSLYLGFTTAQDIVFIKDLAIKKRQIWRTVTPFLFAGTGFNLVLSLFNLFRYSSEIETKVFYTTSDYALFVMFNMFVIQVLSNFVNGWYLFDALSIALVYCWSVNFPDVQATLLVLPVKGRLLPYASLAITFLMAGTQAAIIQSLGIISAFVYNFLKNDWPLGGGPDLLRTPSFMRTWLDGSTNTTSGAYASRARPYGSVYVPQNRANASKSSSSTSSQTNTGATGSSFSNITSMLRSRSGGQRLGSS